MCDCVLKRVSDRRKPSAVEYPKRAAPVLFNSNAYPMIAFIGKIICYRSVFEFKINRFCVNTDLYIILLNAFKLNPCIEAV